MPLKKQYKSAEIVPTDSSDTLTDLEPTPPVASSVLAAIDNNTALLDTHDSVDWELDSLPKTSPVEECVKETQSKAVKARRSRKKAEVENAAASEHTPDVPIKVLYNMLIFPASKSKKDNIKKRKGLTSYFKLDSDKPYDTWKAQLLVQISQKLNPIQIAYKDYDVSFTVPRVYPSPLLIMTDNDYNFLLKHVRKAKEPMANVYVQEKTTTAGHKHKCDDLSSSADRSDVENSHKKRTKKKKKTHAPKDIDIDKANWPLNKNICALHDRWVCHKKPGCESKFCFINPLDGSTHIPLTFVRLDCWAATMLKGPATATLETLLNHEHFQMLPDDLVGQRLVLVDRHLQIKNTKATGAASCAPIVPAAPVVNVNFPLELFKMFQGSHVPPVAQALPDVMQTPLPPTSANALFSPQQIQSIGERMSIQEFGSTYDLSPSLRAKLIEQGYNSTHTLCFATIDDLLASRLLCGEIAHWVEN
ncbi:hypothetical protein EDC04DRAFT_2910613 [Pisolithus marmoratus]|nr:hypothetical protein EDC04DRAFT_2910613 [Pisolithus marmoratus]